VNYTF